MKFRIRWHRYETEDDAMVDWAAVKDLVALNDYSEEILILFRMNCWL